MSYLTDPMYHLLIDALLCCEDGSQWWYDPHTEYPYVLVQNDMNYKIIATMKSDKVAQLMFLYHHPSYHGSEKMFIDSEYHTRNSWKCFVCFERIERPEKWVDLADEIMEHLYKEIVWKFYRNKEGRMIMM